MPPVSGKSAAAIRRGRFKMLAILLVCAIPVIASYFTYYVIRPEGRTNYGEMVLPLRDVSGLVGVGPDGITAGLAGMKGRWLMVTGAGADCDAACEQRLYLMRQVRLTTGKDRDRVERVLVVTGDATLSKELLARHEGLIVIRAGEQAMRDAGFPDQPSATAGQRIWIVDPLGVLVMGYPVQPDPSRMKKDLQKLLKASRVG
jgi:hypothetical protein